jgi:NTE family protein
MSAPAIGLALGSGGARGWCHIGVIRALEAAGLQPALVAGCSMGALVGAAWAAGKLDALEDWVRALTPGRYVQMVDIRPASGGIVAAGEIAGMLAEIGVPERIEDLPRPFAAVATDMETGREVWLREGSVVDAVRASVAIPGVISPARVGGKWLLDGGMVNPVPVSLARAMGAELIVAVNPNAKRGGRLWSPPPRGTGWKEVADMLPDSLRDGFLDMVGPSDDKPPHYLDVVSTAIDIMTEGIRRSRLAGDPPDVMLNVALEDLTIMDLHRADEAIAEGRRVAERNLTEIAGLVGVS